MIPKTLIFAFMASCFVSSSVASPCKASSTSTEVSSSTTIETASTTTQSEGAIETSTAFQDTTTQVSLETDLVTATSTLSEEATPTSDASSTTQPPTVPNISIDCAVDQDCDAALGQGIYACIDLLCQKTATAP
ncbi:uncharacterized protein B0J16DRAFT_385026 [Fusarium flagelliforme]|uniref:Uncharacterized protein n=1 Tax=Fusarium flagelliforme TaxID=2675880 RepID=A0A395MQT3_9HYPO|nr:uncharacterized protein B0J16DRAFT_385026 [Fusarium flagelliforme]KAH7185975.1 hypothetical protein B0J16DRAFT_385026 [Fusarium flagelliforme]RFN49489.1 hypothetical protein FIE12Z_6279 [Fusarium flagelliforme]